MDFDDGEDVTGRAKGGFARAEALTPQERREIARNAALARWTADIPKATHEGPLEIRGADGVVIPCAVLEDGTRLLSRIGFLRAIGRKGKAKGGRRYDQESQLPVFLTAENLKPFISNELIENSKPVPFRPLKGSTAMGYRAELLPLVCNVFLDAKEAKALRPNQEHIADMCKILIRGFAVTGITALVDEATGYQEVRDRFALQKILDAYLTREFAAWAKRFPDEFYQQIFRLRNWTWKGMKVNRPQVVAKYTNDFVYARLAPKILEELQDRNPADETGRRKAMHHQFLTVDVGHPALAQHLHSVIGLMRASDSWDQFRTLIDKAFPRKTRVDDLPLFSKATSPAT